MGNLIHFIWEQRPNRRYLLAAVLISVGLMVVFKLFYPYPNMVLDSYYYVQAAAAKANVAIWPIGYSKFLRVIIVPFHSTTVLVWIQYFLLEFACMLFFFTIFYFWKLAKHLKQILFIFLFLNPLFLFSCNFILSDALFLALSLLWITLLIWIIKAPRTYMIGAHALLLLAAFSVRNNALFYPAIAALAFLLSPLNLWKKLLGIVLQIFFVGLFMWYTANQMADLTGERIFTPFTGWKMANNALYMYGHLYRNDTTRMPNRFASLDKVVRGYFDTVQSVDNLFDYNAFAGGSYYMFKPYSPLIRYINLESKTAVTFVDLESSAPVATLYSGYGQYLIKRHPIAFIRYFIWPDAIRYTYPPMENFSSATAFFIRPGNLGEFASKWLGVETLTVTPFLRDLRTAFISPFPILISLIHLAFLIGLTGFLIYKGIQRSDKSSTKCLLLIVSYCALEFCFSVTTASMILRYLLFIMVIKFTFSLVFIDYMYKLDKN
jgi:hypothetical protein